MKREIHNGMSEILKQATVWEFVTSKRLLFFTISKILQIENETILKFAAVIHLILFKITTNISGWKYINTLEFVEHFKFPIQRLDCQAYLHI